MSNLSDTQEKIQVNMKDHDVLIAVFTMQQEMSRRMDEDRRAAQERGLTLAGEMKAIAIEQARIATEITNFKSNAQEMDKRIDNLERKSQNMDIISYALAAIAGLIAWFKP